MIKTIRRYVFVEVEQWLAAKPLGFLKLRTKSKSPKRIVFERVLDEKRRMWFEIEADEHSSFHVFVYWTKEGKPASDVERDFFEGPIEHRCSGCIELADERLVGDDLPVDGERMFYIAEPPVEIQQEALAEWHKTSIYAKSREMLKKQMQRKNPAVSDAEVDEEQAKGDRVLFGLWQSIEENILISDAVLKASIGPLVEKIEYLFERYAIPTLDSLLQDNQAECVEHNGITD